MMQRPLAPVNCPNCGVALADPSLDACPVCSYALNTPAAVGAVLPRTVSELQTGLDDLLTRARGYGLEGEDILRVLQDELAFAAELARPGHRYSVQVIDLGPHELGLRQPLPGDPRVALPIRPAVTGAPRTNVSSAKPL